MDERRKFSGVKGETKLGDKNIKINIFFIFFLQEEYKIQSNALIYKKKHIYKFTI